MYGRILLVAAGVVACLGVACFGGDEPGPTPTVAINVTQAPATVTPLPEVTATATPKATATEGPPPLPTPQESESVIAKTIWLVDVAESDVLSLVENYESFGVYARFTETGDAAYVSLDEVTTAYGLDGSDLGPVPGPGACTYVPEAEQIDGRWHPSLDCGGASVEQLLFLSPDGRWFLYRIEVPDSGGTPVFPPMSALWALNLETGERRSLQEGMQDCGGCDGVFGPTWSSSGRYVAFAETGGEARVFLSDLEAETTFHISNGNSVQDRPQWSPADDLVLYKSAAGNTVFEDLTGGSMHELDRLPWPTTFDLSGHYIYTPAFVSGPKEGESAATTLVPLGAFDVSSQLDGAPEWLAAWRDVSPVFAGDRLVAALIGAAGCDGTQIYIDGAKLTCIESGSGATISPDGRKVAVARVTGSTGQVEYPGGGAVSLDVFEIVVTDVTSGEETVVATDAVSSEAPFLEWNNASTHLLVTWPVFGGL